MDTFSRFVTMPTAALSALTGGVLFGFSTFIMPALRQVPAPTGIRVMQQINLLAPRSILMIPVLGSTIGCVAIAAWTGTHRSLISTKLLWIGAVCGIASFVVTATLNIPQNNALAHLEPSSSDSIHPWLDYATRWTMANHARTALSLLSGGALAMAAHLT